MLKHLTIQNYAIISSLEIDFPGGMNAVTGETGAGKSIIIGALGLILGDRADSSSLVNKEKKCIVEGVFDNGTKKNIKSFLKENELDTNEELVLRREISANGKSRAFVNDTPVNLEQLRVLSNMLVDLHQQFDSLQLNENNFQREVLDALAEHSLIVNEFGEKYNDWKEKLKKLEELRSRKLQSDREADYNKFQFNELDEASFSENELEEIDIELKTLNNAEGIKKVLSGVYFELKAGEKPMLQQLKVLQSQLQQYDSYHNKIPEILNRFHSTQVELDDLAEELDVISNEVNYDQEKIELLNDRLSLGYKLLKKHGVKTTSELIQIKNQLGEKLQSVLDIEDNIMTAEKEASKIEGELNKSSEKISEGRKKVVKPFEERVNKLLAQVGMPNAKIRVEIKEETQLNPFGKNSIQFLFDANKSKQFLPIAKVASGGELSRLMLCIKSLVAKKMDMPTLIFDEIDTGISGEAAKQVGVIMKELSLNRQVICITHQPQIAGKANAHFLVYKEIVDDKIKTNIRLLNNEERIITIAKMLSGEKPTAAAMENAREMINN